MRGFIITTLKTKRSQLVQTLHVAVMIVGAAAEDIVWTIENEGIWESDFWSVTDIVTNLEHTSSQLLDGRVG
jgi:hypothetical protein